MADFKCGSTGELIRELEAERDRLRKERDEWRELYESVDSKRDALSACVAELKQQLDEARDAFMLGIVERCQKLGIQECHSCPRSDCCDNTNPVVQENKRLREGLEEAAATMAGMLRVHPDLAEISNVDNTVIFIRQLITPPPSPDSAVLCPDGSRVTLEHVGEENCPKREDKFHCNCWYDGEKCCACGAPAMTREQKIEQGMIEPGPTCSGTGRKK